MVVTYNLESTSVEKRINNCKLLLKSFKRQIQIQFSSFSFKVFSLTIPPQCEHKQVLTTNLKREKMFVGLIP